MFDKKAFLASIASEAKILTHLAAQLDESRLGYRPSEAQRSTLDLLQYLSIAPAAVTIYAITGTWDHWDAMDQKSKAVTLATFPKALKAQTAQITKTLKPFTDNALKRKKTTTFAGTKTTLGAGLIEMVLKLCAAYRMQLFLYAKASGLTHLDSGDVWAGKRPKAAKKKG